MSKLRIEKLKQGISSNNDVLVYRNDLGTFQGQSNVVLNTITLGGNTVNSSVYTGTSLNANSTTYFGGQLSTYYANATVAGTAYANAVANAASDATTKAATAYSNAISYAGTIAGTAYSNAISTASSDATTKAGTAYSNAIAYSGNAALAYANAIAYAASNTYVNSTFAPLASPTLTGLLTANNVTITGNLTVSGTTTYVNTTNLNIGDNIITLNADLGASAPSENAGFEVMRGTSANVSLLWDETSDYWSFSSNVNISANLNTTGTVSANVLSVSNVEQTQTNLQVDPAGSAFLNAIIYG